MITLAACVVTALLTLPASADDGTKVVCIAGCGSTTPVTVYRRPDQPQAGSGATVAPEPTRWKEYTFDVWCADGLGCKALNNIRIGNRGHVSSFRSDPFWR